MSLGHGAALRWNHTRDVLVSHGLSAEAAAILSGHRTTCEFSCHVALGTLQLVTFARNQTLRFARCHLYGVGYRPLRLFLDQ